MKYYTQRDKLVFISKNKVKCTGGIINLLETLYLGFEMQVEVIITYKYHD